MRVDLVVAATSTPQKVGIAVAVLVVVGWAAYLVMHLRRPESPPPGSEIELAPNRKPYLDDGELEGPKLDKSLKWALVTLVVSAVGLPAYWLNEPSRQAGAERGFDERSARRGYIMFQPASSDVPAGNVGHFGCGECHGNEGQGGSVRYALGDPLDPSKPPRQVVWEAPALNTAALRYTDDQLRSVLVYGRPNTPMPAWGVLGGGPMNDQQIDDLIAYMKQLADEVDTEKLKADAMAKYGLDGKSLFEAYCARCHTKGWSYGEPEEPGGGAFGPSLLDGATLRQFPNIEDHIEFVANSAQYGKAYGTRGVAGNEAGGMPRFGEMLTEEQIRAVVEYERSL
ncbi:MAG TPA: cytochrome c [Acidimicrobiales bacterium]|nr:cytochrome c [Acidimicrobiales bacterium]